MTWLGQLFEQEGRNTEAVQEYKGAIALDPHEKNAREGLRRVEKK